jgi:branched-chain amino acid transport system permease protein
MSSYYAAHIVLFQQTAIMAILALSVQVVLRSGVFSFASMGFYCVGSYAAADTAVRGVPGVLDLVVVVVGTAVVGYGLSFCLIRLRGLYLGMVTFAFDLILIVVADNAGAFTGGSNGIFGVPLQVTTPELFVLAAIAAVVVSQTERRVLGRRIQILRIDEQLGASLGISQRRQRSFLFCLSAALGAVAGALNTLSFGTVAPTSFGFPLIVAGLTMAVIGGIRRWSGALLGAVVVVWLPEVLSGAGRYSAAIYGGLVAVLMIFEPNGLLGVIGRIARLATRRRRSPATPADQPIGVPEAEVSVWQP